MAEDLPTTYDYVLEKPDGSLECKLPGGYKQDKWRVFFGMTADQEKSVNKHIITVIRECEARIQKEKNDPTFHLNFESHNSSQILSGLTQQVAARYPALNDGSWLTSSTTGPNRGVLWSNFQETCAWALDHWIQYRNRMLSRDDRRKDKRAEAAPKQRKKRTPSVRGGDSSGDETRTSLSNPPSVRLTKKSRTRSSSRSGLQTPQDTALTEAFLDLGMTRPIEGSHLFVNFTIVVSNEITNSSCSINPGDLVTNEGLKPSDIIDAADLDFDMFKSIINIKLGYQENEHMMYYWDSQHNLLPFPPGEEASRWVNSMNVQRFMSPNRALNFFFHTKAKVMPYLNGLDPRAASFPRLDDTPVPQFDTPALLPALLPAFDPNTQSLQLPQQGLQQRHEHAVSSTPSATDIRDRSQQDPVLEQASLVPVDRSATETDGASQYDPEREHNSVVSSTPLAGETTEPPQPSLERPKGGQDSPISIGSKSDPDLQAKLHELFGSPHGTDQTIAEHNPEDNGESEFEGDAENEDEDDDDAGDEDDSDARPMDQSDDMPVGLITSVPQFTVDDIPIDVVTPDDDLDKYILKDDRMQVSKALSAGDQVGEQTVDKGDDDEELDVEDRVYEMLHSKEVEQFDEGDLRECCEVLGLSFEVVKNARSELSVEGLKVKLWPYQIYGVWKSIKMLSTKGNGLFLADAPGLGKTVELLTIAWVLRALSIIDKTLRKTNRPGHLKKDPGEKERCNFTNQLGIKCACEYQSPTTQMMKNKGLKVLIVVPPNILSQWLQEIKKIFVPSARKRLYLFVAYQYDAAQKSEFARDFPELAESNQEYLTNEDSCTWIITTPQSMQSRLEGIVPMSGVNWGLVIVDEFHTNRTKGTILMKLLRGILENSTRPAPYWVFASGTPFEQSISEMEAQLGVIQDEYLDFDEKGEYVVRDGLDASKQILVPEIVAGGKLIRKYCNITSYDPELRQQIEKPLEDANEVLKFYMICRNTRTLWYGNPAVLCPPHVTHDLFIEAEGPYKQIFERLNKKLFKAGAQDHLKRLKKWEDKSDFYKRTHPEPKSTDKAFINYSRLIRAMGLFPALVDTKYYNSGFIQVKTANKIYQKAERHEVWKAHGDELIKSPKIQVLFELIKQGEKVGQHHPYGQKGIVFTESPFAAAIVWLCLRQVVNNERLALFASKLTPSKRSDFGVDFMHWDESRFDWAVGTTKTCGVGMTLSSSFRIYCLELDYMLNGERQRRGRIDRNVHVQRARKTQMIRIIQKGLVVDTIIYKRHIKRNTVRTLQFNPERASEARKERARLQAA